MKEENLKNITGKSFIYSCAHEKMIEIYFTFFFLTEKTELIDQEKWDNILRKIETNLRRDDFSNVLELVDDYLLDCKSPEIRLHALMTKVDCCFEAWKQTSKSK